MSKSNYLMTEAASAQIEIDCLRDQLKDEKIARKLLRDKGFFVDNLWCTADVMGTYNCSAEMAQKILSKAFANEATMIQIWEAIDDAAEDLEIKKWELEF